MNIERIGFNAKDNAKLVGIMYCPETKTDEIVISVHGMTSDCLKERDEAIASEVIKNNVAYMTFNNRGHDIISYTKFDMPDATKKTILGGTAYEEVLDSYFDVKGAIDKAIELGFNKIHLQGHSLGCTKIVFTYQKLIKNNETEILDKIKSVILLSLIDIPGVLKIFLGSKYQMMIDYTKAQLADGKGEDLMPNGAFIHLVSVRTFARYLIDNKELNFAQYGNNLYAFKELNDIKANLYMRWGNVNELIAQDPKKLVDNLNSKIKPTDNKKVDINFVNGANHSYQGKFDIISKEIANFIK